MRAAIGSDLDDMFGISESMAEYEAENEQEELTEWIKDAVLQHLGELNSVRGEATVADAN